MPKLVASLCLVLISCAGPSGSHAPPSDLVEPPAEFYAQIGEAGQTQQWSCGRCDEPETLPELFGEGAYLCHNCKPRNYEAVIDFTIHCINIDAENDAVRGGKATPVLGD